jgi:hypothetical protein
MLDRNKVLKEYIKQYEKKYLSFKYSKKERNWDGLRVSVGWMIYIAFGEINEIGISLTAFIGEISKAFTWLLGWSSETFASYSYT